MAKTETVKKKQYITMSKQEAADLIAFLAAGLAEHALPFRAKGEPATLTLRDAQGKEKTICFAVDINMQGPRIY